MMKYAIKYTSKMKKSAKLMQKRGKDMRKLAFVIDELAQGRELDEIYCDYQLKGKLKDFRECHIEPDWLLMYRIDNQQLILTATDTGSHSDMFG